MGKQRPDNDEGEDSEGEDQKIKRLKDYGSDQEIMELAGDGCPGGVVIVT
jgi:hypothetical protein